MQPYERFEAWQFAHKLNLATHRITVSWPVAERYGLTAQVRRCAFSVVANMVEGSAKRGRREFARFLDISIGSLAELSYAFRFAREGRIPGRGRSERARGFAGIHSSPDPPTLSGRFRPRSPGPLTPSSLLTPHYRPPVRPSVSPSASP